MILSDRHLGAAIDYLRRCRDAGDRRPLLELLRDILSPADARLIRRALIELPYR